MAKKRRKKQQLNVKQRDNSGVPGLYPAQTGARRFGPTTGLVGCDFYFFLVVYLFWTRVYLFLAPNGPGIPVLGRCPNINIIPGTSS